jgi:hypothetical protein
MRAEFAILVIPGIFLLSFVVAYAFFVLALYKCVQRIRPENRGMEPALVWLNLIPVFNLGWTFYIVTKLTDGIKKELGSEAGDGGWGLGLAHAILLVASFTPGFGHLISLAFFVVWILYWIKIAEFSRRMETARLPQS